ncbi:MAG: hypothetical protein IJP38_00645 [Oscillospiraceae bacterium]|nr:hypothetical protein [Oscillospiraceae bacterium]
MTEIIEIPDPQLTQPEVDKSILEIADGLLFEARREISEQKTLSIPIAELATLGAGVSSLIPALRTVTQTTIINTSGLYRVANKAATDTLKVAKNGNLWGWLKKADGTSKAVQLQPAEPLSATTQSVAAINPATMMMAVALFSIEQKLGEIEKMQKRILSFLEIEKESEIEADVETLCNIISKYKLNWDNAHFVASNHKLVLDIQRTARKNINVYQKKVVEMLGSKKFVVVQSRVKSTLEELLKKFKYYRLSLYIFSMASMMEIMLSGNFDEEYIAGIRKEIENLSSAYRDLFDKCSIHLEKISEVSVETNILKGIGTASKAVGKLIGSIPFVKEGKVDEFLADSGNNIESNAKEIEMSVIAAFAEISNPETRVFIDRMEDMIQIYNHTASICFDDKMIYLIAE